MVQGEDLLIGVRVRELSRSSFKMEYRIERDGEITAEGETALVSFDYEKRKPRRLDADFKGRVMVAEGID